MPTPSPAKIASIYISNMPYSASEEELRDHLTFLGLEVVAVRIARDRTTGEARGFAFADVRGNLESSVAAITGTRLDGRPLRASAALARNHG